MGKYKDDEFNFEIDVKEIYPNYPDARSSDMDSIMKISDGYLCDIFLPIEQYIPQFSLCCPYQMI